MKKLLTFAALLQLSSVVVNAQAVQSTITCNVQGGTDRTTVCLYQFKGGKEVKLGDTKLNDKKIALFKVDAKKEGVYFVAPSPTHTNNFKHAIYLKPGEQVNLTGYVSPTITLDFDSCNVVKASAETKALQAWMDKYSQFIRERVNNKSLDFYAKYAELENFAETLKKTNKTANANFNSFLSDKINVDLHYLKAANYFRFNLRGKDKDSSAAKQSFYKSLDNTKILQTTAVLNSERGQDFLQYMLSYWVAKRGLKPISVFDNTNLIANDEVKAYYLVNYFGMLTTLEDFTKYITPYKNLFANGELKAIYTKKYNELSKYAKGVPALNFSLKDANENTYTLESFKGKVVVIDLWATWCIPCRREKPTFMKIEEEYHGRNDIVFIGISQNKIKEKDSWKKFVKENGYNGLELLDHENLFTDYYDLSSIPRYLIFDRNGKVVTADAPRPTTPEFKKVIEQALASK